MKTEKNYLGKHEVTPGVTIEIWYTNKHDSRGVNYLQYEYKHEGKIIFKGDGFCPSPLHAIDSPECFAALVRFLSLKPGDTDEEYFDNYTPEQIEYAETYGEEMSMWADGIENAPYNSLDEMIRHKSFHAYQESNLGNDLFTTDPDRADRIHKAAENGADGSTHLETITDWRNFLDSEERDGEVCELIANRIREEIDDCENWHEKNGSLEEIIG